MPFLVALSERVRGPTLLRRRCTRWTRYQLAAQIDVDDPPRSRDVVERVAINHDEVGDLAGGERPELVEAEHRGGRAGAGDDRLRRRQPGPHHVLELDVLRPPEQPAGAGAADVGAERELHAGSLQLADVPRDPVPL